MELSEEIKEKLNHYREISIEELVEKGEPHKKFKVRGKISSWNISGKEITFSVSDDLGNFLLCSINEARQKFSMPNGREVLVYGWLASHKYAFLDHLFKVDAIADARTQRLIYLQTYL